MAVLVLTTYADAMFPLLLVSCAMFGAVFGMGLLLETRPVTRKVVTRVLLIVILIGGLSRVSDAAIAYYWPVWWSGISFWF